MDWDKRVKIVIGIDFFSRKSFAMVLNTKEAEGVVRFLTRVYEEFNFKMLQSDNGREFSNKKIEKWCKDRKIVQKFTTPHYHQGNGRVERVIRTIRNMLKRTQGPLKVKLSKVINAYNNSKHRGIGMSPNKALIKENYEAVRLKSKEYSREFKPVKHKRYNIGDNVILKNELKLNKNDDEFKRLGTISDVLENDNYVIKTKNNKMLTRHSTQLKVWPGDVGFE